MARCLIQDVADAVAAVALAKEEDWSYALPKFEEPPATVAHRPGRDLPADVRGRLAGDDGRHPRLLRRRGRAAAHDLPGGDAGVRQGEVPGPPGGGDRPGQGEVPARPITWGSPTGPRGTGSSSGGTPTCR